MMIIWYMEMITPNWWSPIALDQDANITLLNINNMIVQQEIIMITIN